MLSAWFASDPEHGTTAVMQPRAARLPASMIARSLLLLRAEDLGEGRPLLELRQQIRELRVLLGVHEAHHLHQVQRVARHDICAANSELSAGVPRGCVRGSPYGIRAAHVRVRVRAPCGGSAAQRNVPLHAAIHWTVPPLSMARAARFSRHRHYHRCDVRVFRHDTLRVEPASGDFRCFTTDSCSAKARRITTLMPPKRSGR